MENSGTIEKYGTTWDSDDAIQIEMAAIRYGGKWEFKGKQCGLGLFQHFKNLQSMLWPRKKWHRWNELLLSQFVDRKIIGIVGPASSGKTREACDFGLTCYFVWPDSTSVMVSSTDSRSLELRIWGEIKKQWAEAKNVYDGLPGHIIGSKQLITTDGKDAPARDFRNGIVGIPCVQNGTFVGLGKYVGVKNQKVILLADECQFMTTSFFDAIANLNKNRSFKCLAMGNPKDRMDALGRICEPSSELGGWDNLVEDEKTKVWNTRFDNGVCINLVGTDSPNFDAPPGAKPPFPFLISRSQIEQDEKFYGRDTLQFSMMNLGIFPKEAISKRIITRSMCEKFGAMDEPVWDDAERVRIGGLDAAYGNTGGDRCIFTEIHYGRDKTGKQILAYIGTPVIVPVSIKRESLPEDQIAKFVRVECERRNIPPENLFYDSTGRGTLGGAFARLWSNSVVSVEFGGLPTERRVAADSPKTCKEHFTNMVAELWYATRMVIECGQFRGLPEEVMLEGCMRQWDLKVGNKIWVEPKEETKLRMGRSPDLFDSLVVAVEGARQRGFVIERLGGNRRANNMDWLFKLRDKHLRMNRSKKLQYV